MVACLTIQTDVTLHLGCGFKSECLSCYVGFNLWGLTLAHFWEYHRHFFEGASVDSVGCVCRFTLCGPLDPECVGIVVVDRISMA